MLVVAAAAAAGVGAVVDVVMPCILNKRECNLISFDECKRIEYYLNTFDAHNFFLSRFYKTQQV